MSQQEKLRESDFSSRLREARQILGITQESLAKQWGVEGNYIYILESGRRGFPRKWQIKVIELEEMVSKKISAKKMLSVGPEIRSGNLLLREEEKENRLSLSDRGAEQGDVRMGALLESGPLRQVPVVGFVAGANMLLNRKFDYTDMANQIEENFTTDSKDPNALGLIVEGDSMDPEYQEGDRIVVAPNAEPRNRDVVVARLAEEGSAMLKRFFRTGPEGKTIRLESTNPNYAPIIKEISEFRFIYPVVDMRRKPRR